MENKEKTSEHQNINEFLAALSFLSRLAPARIYAEREMGRSLRFYPPAGLALGLAAVAPLFLGLWAGKPLLQSWFFVVWLAFLTRALHWDGWADLFDALGSGKRGEKFFEVLKDSRIGVFGGVALALGLLGQFILVYYCLEANGAGLAALVWAVLAGRCCVAPLFARAGTASCSSLGRLIGAGLDGGALYVSVVFAFVAGGLCVGFQAMLFGFLIASAGVIWLGRVARREGGLNGDFIGAGIIWGEFSALLGVMLAL